MHHALASAALAAMALCAALPAAAGSVGTQQAAITNVKIELVDLDLNDGITPGISFSSGGYVATWISAPGAPEDRVQTPFAVGSAFNATRSQGSHAVAFSMLAGSLLGAGSGPGALATHTGSGAGGVAGEGQVIFSDFTLTPHTRLVISAAGSGSVAGYVGGGGDFVAWAGAGVNIFSTTLQTTLASDFVNASLNAQGQGTLAESRGLLAAYDNTGSAPFSASISAVAYVGAAEAAPVPEPTTATLLGGGLLAWAVARARARKR